MTRRAARHGTLEIVHLAAWFAEINSFIELHAGAPWVLPALFAFCTIDGFFPPVPSESLVVGLAAVGQPPWWAILLAGAAGAVAGDNIAYWVGRRLGTTRLLSGGPKRRRIVRWSRDQLRRRGPLCILVARYIPAGRVAVNAMAGATRFSYKVFLVVDIIAGLAWGAYAVAIGAGASSLIGNNHLLAMAIGVVGAILIGAVLDQILRRVMPARDAPDQPGQSEAADREQPDPVHDDQVRQDSTAA
jgi:membrane protein DedA with SNARE-associated domain